jgi:Domain of unknown function (DUF4326)
MTHPLVSNVRTDGCDVYVGRPSVWGNRVSEVRREGERDKAIEQYREWLYAPEQAAFREAVQKHLRGQVLGCWCAPKPCHADLLAELANS